MINNLRNSALTVVCLEEKKRRNRTALPEPNSPPLLDSGVHAVSFRDSCFSPAHPRTSLTWFIPSFFPRSAHPETGGSPHNCLCHWWLDWKPPPSPPCPPPARPRPRRRPAMERRSSTRFSPSEVQSHSPPPLSPHPRCPDAVARCSSVLPGRHPSPVFVVSAASEMAGASPLIR